MWNNCFLCSRPPDKVLLGKKGPEDEDKLKTFPPMTQLLQMCVHNMSGSSSYSPPSLYNLQNADEQFLLSWLQMAGDIKMNTSILKIYSPYADVKEFQK